VELTGNIGLHAGTQTKPSFQQSFFCYIPAPSCFYHSISKIPERLANYIWIRCHRFTLLL